MLGRSHYQQGIAIGEIGEIAGGLNARAELQSAQIDWVFVDRVDGRDHVVFQRPQDGFAAPVRRDLCERRSPGAAADDPEFHALTPAPRTFSARSSSGQRARAGASSASHMPPAKRSTPAQAIIAALSVHSQPGGTLKRRPCVFARSASAVRIAWFAATPPATTSAGASLLSRASRLRSTRQSTTAC